MDQVRGTRNTRWNSRWALAAAAGTLLLGGLAGLRAAPAANAAPAGDSIGKKAPGFRLKDQSGKLRTLDEFASKKAVVLVFLGTQCPISNSYAEPLSQLSAKFADRGVQFLGVNCSPDEGWEEVARHAKEYRFTFPVLKDEKQVAADGVGARVTPEAFVLDQNRLVRYRGRVDDSYASRTQKRNRVSSRDLEQALEAVLAGKPVAQPVTQAFGCAIVRPQTRTAKATGPTFYKDVLPILQESCQSCHRPGQVAPFSLISYQDARSWATEIKTFTQKRQMPPWKAEPGHGEFQDVRRLSDEQVATLAAWADGGAPAGSEKDAPAEKSWPTEWMLGQPDLVLTMPEEYSVTATGDDDFRCFVLPTGLTEEKQVVAVEVRPGNPRVVHHVLNFIDTSGRARALDERDPAPGYNSGPGGIGFLPGGGLGGWAPGNMPRKLPDGVFRPLPAKSDLVVQVHYHKTGKPEKDRTSIGIYFAKEPQKLQARTFPLTNLFINIPPDVARHEVKASMVVPVDSRAIAVTPHMHLLGKEMRVTATLPDGTQKSMVWIKDWDYRWQDTYIYKEPVVLPKGTRLEMVAYFDNTSQNPLNPNSPPKRVTFGEQTTDEMAFAFLEFVTEGNVSPGGLGRLLGF